MGLLLLVPGCAATSPVDRAVKSDLVWPLEQPRIRLHSVIPMEGRGRRTMSKLLAAVGAGQVDASFLRPYAVAWDGEDLVVADPDTGRVARIGRRGRVVMSDRVLFRTPVGVAVCSGGIVVSDSEAGAVALLNRDLDLERWLARELARPTGVACEGERVFVSETGRHRLLIIGPDGTRSPFGERGSGPGQFNFPTSIAVSGSELLVADTMNFRIQRLDLATGDYVGRFGELGDAPGQMPRIKGIAVDDAGQVWVADAHLDRVALYDLAGTYLTSIGGSGSGPGEFAFPAGIAVADNGRIAVVDSLNRRLQVFGLLPEPSTR